MNDYRVHFQNSTSYVSLSAPNRQQAARRAQKCLQALAVTGKRRRFIVAKVERHYKDGRICLLDTLASLARIE